MPKLKISQFCAGMIRRNVQNFKSFEIVKHGHLSLQNLPKNDIFGPRTHFGPHLITVDQIQVKLVSAQTYLGNVLLQSILGTLDFPLLSYNPLKM